MNVSFFRHLKNLWPGSPICYSRAAAGQRHNRAAGIKFRKTVESESEHETIVRAKLCSRRLVLSSVQLGAGCTRCGRWQWRKAAIREGSHPVSGALHLARWRERSEFEPNATSRSVRRGGVSLKISGTNRESVHLKADPVTDVHYATWTEPLKTV